MKRAVWKILPLLIPVLVISLGAWKDVTKGPDFPKKVSGILEQSCFNCHTTGSKVSDAVESIDFLKWDELSKTKKISNLNDMQEVLGEGKMPPERFLKKHPDKALSEKDKNILIKWTKTEISTLMGDS